MEMHLFNAAKQLKMERSYKAFFIDLKLPVSLLTSEKLDDKSLKHISLLFRNFKLNNKDTLSLCPNLDSMRGVASTSDRPQNTWSSKLIRLQSVTQDSVAAETSKLSNSGAPSSRNLSPKGQQPPAKCCHMDYSLYDVEAAAVDSFANINRFTLYYYQNGDLDVNTENPGDAAFVDIYLLLALKKIVVADSSHREHLSEAVVKAIISKLRGAFHSPLQKILHSSALKLNGPIIYNAVNRSLAGAFSVTRSVVSTH